VNKRVLHSPSLNTSLPLSPHIKPVISLGHQEGQKFSERGPTFEFMSNSFKPCPTHFPRGGEKFSRGASAPGYGPGAYKTLYLSVKSIVSKNRAAHARKHVDWQAMYSVDIQLLQVRSFNIISSAKTHLPPNVMTGALEALYTSLKCSSK